MIVSDNAMTIMKERVLHKGETPEDMVKRVAKTVAMGDEVLEEAFYSMMNYHYFLPNSPCLANAGTLGQLSACFVLPIEDSMESIMGTLYNASMIQKTGGGTGFSFNRLRPRGDVVQTTGGEASGPVSFMRMYNAVMEEIKQGGRRRGASLGVLNVDHLDILEFIECKRNQDQLTNFNISVGVTDEFMKRVQSLDTDALQVWGLLTECAWETGEPGILFLDAINRDNPTPYLGKIEACNPCSEANLLPYESCVLGSINLSQLAKDGRFDFVKLKKVVGMAVHFLDNVIDCSVYPMPEIEHATKQTRKIGLGIMGLADAMYLMGIRYGSERFYELSEEIMKSINTAAQKQSKGLAQEKGSYPAYIPPNLRRNAVVTSIAPTGTLASIAGTSFSAEPNYGLVYKRTILDGREMYEVNPIFQRELRRRGLDTEAILDQVAHNNGSVQGIREIPADMKEVFVTAYDLTWDVHVKIQSVLQKHVEQSISKTINMAENATVQDIKDAYMMAWESNCKGITVYRDGSRANQVLSTDKHTPTKRPDVLEGKTHKFNTDCGSLYVTVNRDLGGDPHEIFTAHSVKQGCVNALLNSLARVTSISLRSGVDPAAISKAMMGQVCGNGEEVTSCADALGVALRETQPPVCSLEGGCATCG